MSEEIKPAPAILPHLLKVSPERLLALAVQAAAIEGPSRVLDAEIWWALADHEGTDAEFTRMVRSNGVVSLLDKTWPSWRGHAGPPVRSLTSSIDDVLRLRDELMPECRGMVLTEMENPESGCQAEFLGAFVNGRTLAGSATAALLHAVIDEIEAAMDPDA